MAKIALKVPAIKLPIGKIAPVLLQALAVFGGVSGGILLKSGAATLSPPESGEHGAGHEKEADAHAKPDDHGAKPDAHAKTEAKKEKKPKEKKAAKDGHGGADTKAKSGGHGEAEADTGTGFMKFSRQFVVPVIDNTGVRSLVVMDINIETPPGGAESTYAREPKLRDAMLSALLNLSNDGAFDQRLLERDNLDSIRAKLLTAARSVIGEEATNVLILNITRQDVS